MDLLGVIRLKILIICIITGGMFLFPSHFFAQNIDSISIEIQKLISSSNVEEQRDFAKNFSESVLVANSLSDAKNYFRSKPELALKLITEATDLSLKSKSLHYISLSLEQLGNFYFHNENYEKATPCYLNCLQIEEKLGDEIRFAKMNLNLGRIYNYMEITEKSIDFLQKALEIFQEHNDTLNTTLTFESLGSIYFNRNFWEQTTRAQKDENYDLSVAFYRKAEELANLTGDKVRRANILQGISSVYNRTGKSENALENILETLSIYKDLNDSERISDALFALGITYDKLGQHDDAIKYLNEALEMGKKVNMGGVHWIYESLAEANYNAGNYKLSRDMYVKFINTRDSVLNLEKSHQILELETKYQTEKKQSEIEKLTLVKKQRTLVIYILIAALMLLLLFSYNYFRNIKNKKIIADQQLEIKEKQLLELEKERQLTAAKSVLQGEEIERRRFARDLHDGLGGMLSGLKINLSTMKGNSIITSEQTTAFENALNLIDKSIVELRRVAHNLMPETLNHYGLQTALNDFTVQLNQQISTKINFSFFGEDQRYEPQLELTVFRIAQELLNNALKHADAQQIQVLLFAEKNRVCLQVNDDGKGFVVNSGLLKGSGLAGISNRVDALSGKIDIDSAPGKGTEIAVEFFIS